MKTVLERAIAASDALTVRWIEAVPVEGNMVLSGAAVWPLLALLASGASDNVRTELEGALGLPADAAFDAAKDLIAILDRDDQIAAALGAWLRRDVPMKRAWRKRLPRGVFGTLSGEPAKDQAALDRWVHDRTFQLIDQLPVVILPTTLMVLVEALALRISWVTPFEQIPLSVSEGPWRDRILDGLGASLKDLDLVTIAETDAGAITMFRSVGTGDVDVYLVLGEVDASVSRVLAAAIGAVGREDVKRAADLGLSDRPPGISVNDVRATHEAPPSIRVKCVRSDIDSAHDLTTITDVFGLRSATQGGHAFDRISEVPLIVDQAKQAAHSSLTATGFEAAAVTATAIALGLPRMPFTNRVIEVRFDRPFGFIARHRRRHIALFAGWVHDPPPYPTSRLI